jgi:hypothetical protein
MKARLLFLLFCSSALSLMVTAQPVKHPPADAPSAQERFANVQQNGSAKTIHPSQLRMLPHGSIRSALALSAPRNTTAAASPLGPLGPGGLPLCVIEGETIVGACPDTGISTTVPSVVVPVILNITQGGTAFSFDPTASDDDCLGVGNVALDLTMQSPLFSSAPFVINGEDEGTTQFTDAFTNAQFSTIKIPGYQVLLSATPGPALTINLDAGVAGNATVTIFNIGGTQCGTNPTTNPAAKIAVGNINTIDAQLQSYIAANGLDATMFPYFVLYNSVMSIGPANNINNCCVLGFHNALGAPGQTYGIAEFEGRNQTVFTGVSDTSVGAHEIAEWLDDPGGNNPVAGSWGNIGQTRGCQGNLEVGDPLSGTLMPPVTMPNGFTYNLQELAFFSWFTRDNPSLGAGGVYSSNGTFLGFSNVCPPGGTN